METLEEYKQLLTTELKRRVGLEIGDTRLDDEKIENAFFSAETVKELIDWLIEKDDLNEHSEYSFTY